MESMESANENPRLEQVGPGHQLLKLRQAAGLSLTYVAERMNLPEDYIAALEADEFDKLPPEPYVLGYYRSYARLLNTSPQELISSYRLLRGLPEDAPAPAATTNRAADDLFRKPMVLDRNTRLNGRTKGSGISIYLMIALLLVAVWLLVSLLADKSGQAVTVAPEGAAVDIAMPAETQPATSPLPVPVEELPAQEVEVDLELALPTAIPSLPLETTVADVVADPAVTALAAEPVVAELDQLSFVFSDECWLEVTDAKGDILAASLYQNGDSAQLAGVAPFQIMLGNVRAVQLQLNGEAVALRALDNRKTLRMTLDKPSSPVVAD